MSGFRVLLLSFTCVLFVFCVQAHAERPLPAVSVEDQRCLKTSDCEIAMLKCSCDCGSPVNKNNLEKYTKERASRCKNYHGPVCKMLCPQGLSCVKGICAFREKGTTLSKKSRK